MANYIPAFDKNKDGRTGPKELKAWNAAGRPVDDLAVESMGKNLGYAAEIIRQWPELSKIITDVLKEGITDPNIQLQRITESKWFKSYYPGWLEVEKNKLSSDPAVWEAKLSTAAESIKKMAQEQGAEISDVEARDWADKYLHKSSGQAGPDGKIEVYDEAWLKKTVAGAINFNKTKTVNGIEISDLSGKAEEYGQTLYKVAREYGLNSSMSDEGFRNWFNQSLTGLVSGKLTAQDVDDYAVEQAMSRFPGFAKQIQAGVGLRTAADPYLTAIANELEMDPNQIDFNDDLVQKTLNSVDKDGNFKPMSLYDVRLAARKDGRWQYTSSAKKQYTDVAGQILRDFGFLG